MNVVRRAYSEYTTRDFVVAAVLIALAGVFQTVWGHLVFEGAILGPLNPFFASLGFNIWSFLAVYLIRKPGASILVKTLAGVIELLLGSPVGPIVIWYNFAEGLGADLAFAWMGRRITLNMVIVGSLIAHFVNLPVDMYRDGILFAFEPILVYTSAATIGKAWNGWLIYHMLRLLHRAGVRPEAQYWDEDFASKSPL